MSPPDKNLHTSITDELLKRLEEAVEEDHVSLDEFVAGAIERRLNKRGLDEMCAIGKRHAKERGTTPGDVASAIAAVRAEERERNKK
jgi:stage V sporulation protein SpoVS